MKLSDCLPENCERFLEYSGGRWQTLSGSETEEALQEHGHTELRVFGVTRARIWCSSSLPRPWARCLERLMEQRLLERCRELWGEPDRALAEIVGGELKDDGKHRLNLGPMASEFFGRTSLCWESGTGGEPELERLEDRLERESERALSQLKSEDYSSLLGVFGHHVGTLFKTSGAMTIWSQPDPGDDPTRRVLDKLLPIWGVSQAISLHKKQGEKGWSELLRDWVVPAWVEREDLPEQVQESIISLALYVYAHGVDEPPFLPWVVHLPDGRQARWLWATAETVESGVPEELIEQASSQSVPDKIEVESQTHRLVSLPPLADNPILFDKTLALTIGLFEVLSNLRKYPEARGAGREDRADLAELEEDEKQVDLYIDQVEGSTTLRIEQPVVVLPDGGIPMSRSVERIRGLERSLLKGIIETETAEAVGKTSSPYVVKMRQSWTYHWGKLLEEWRCHVN